MSGHVFGQRLRELLVPLIAVAAAIAVLNVLTWVFGGAPLATLAMAAAGSWGTSYGIGQVLFKATPLLLAGIAVEVALRGGLFNIGVEGQIVVGSLAGTMTAMAIPAVVPGWVALPIALAAAGAMGGAWAGLAGLMRVRFGAHEVITTIMLNRIADALAAMLITGYLAMPGTVRTADLPSNARLPSLASYLPAFQGSAASVAIVLAVVVLVAVLLWSRKSRAGREISWIGINEHACAAEGIAVGRRKILAMSLSGAIAAMAVSATVFGYKGYYELGLGAGVGFGGIAVAFLGRGHPLGLLLAALLFGTLSQAGLAINAQVPREAMGILEAVVIIAVALAARGAKLEAERVAPKERA